MKGILILFSFLSQLPSSNLKIYIDENVKCELALKKVLTTDCKTLINPSILLELDETSKQEVFKKCDEINNRVKCIKDRFTLKFCNRYFERVDYGVQFNYGKINKIPPHLHASISIELIEFWIDEIYFKIDHEEWKKKLNTARDQWVVDDFDNRFKFIENLFNKNPNWEFRDFRNDTFENEHVCRILPTIIFDEKGKVKTMKELGYIPAPRPNIPEPIKKQCPIKIEQ